MSDLAITGLLVLFDTSASRALGFQGQIDRQVPVGVKGQRPARRNGPVDDGVELFGLH